MGSQTQSSWLHNVVAIFRISKEIVKTLTDTGSAIKAALRFNLPETLCKCENSAIIEKQVQKNLFLHNVPTVVSLGRIEFKHEAHFFRCVLFSALATVSLSSEGGEAAWKRKNICSLWINNDGETRCLHSFANLKKWRNSGSFLVCWGGSFTSQRGVGICG